MADWEFERQLGAYVRIVDFVRSGAIPCGPKLELVDTKELPRHVARVRAACCPDGTAIVEFYIPTGVPLVHAGYLFKNYTGTNSCVEQGIWLEDEKRLYQRHVIGNWYRCSD